MRITVVVALAACGGAATPAARPAPSTHDRPTFHDPDHARGELPELAVRRHVLAVIRADLDTVYAHRAAKLARYHLDEDALFAAADAALAAATTWAAYDAVLYDLLAAFHDAHLSYHPPRAAAPAAGYASYRLGFETVLAGGQLLVVSVEPGSDAAAAHLAPGDRIISIDQQSVADLLDREARRRAWSRVESAKAEWAHAWTHVVYGKSETPRAREISWLPRMGSDDALLARILPRPAPHGRADAISAAVTGDVVTIHVRDLDGGAAVLDELDRAAATARGAHRLIVDLRDVRGGVDTIGYRLVGSLVEGTAAMGSARVLLAPQTRAARAQWRDLAAGADGWSDPIPLTAPGQPTGGGFHGTAAVLVDAACASTCEVVAAALRADLHAVIVGETTAGSSGAPIRIGLPVGGDIAVPTWLLTSADGHPIEDDGVVPDVVAVPTADTLAAGRDIVVDEATRRL